MAASAWRKPFDPARPVAFMHVPKAAGTSVIRGLADALGGNAVLAGFDATMFGDFRDFATLAAPLREQIHLTPSTLPAATALLAGHFAYPTLSARAPTAQFATLLREPYSRLLSLWLFWRQHSDRELSPWGAWASRLSVARAPLTAFLTTPEIACHTDNVAVRLLLGPHPRIPAAGFIDPADDAPLLDAAAATLERFAFVDIVENPRLLDNLRGWLGRRIRCGRQNETQPSPRAVRTALHRELTAEAGARLAACSRLDQRLWTEVARRSLPDRHPAAFRHETVRRNTRRFAAIAQGAPA